MSRKQYNIYTGVSQIGVTLKSKLAAVGLGVSALIAGVGLAVTAGAAPVANQVVVTPTNTQGWASSDTRPGGSVNYVVDNTAPGDPHAGALELKTDATNAAKADYMHATNTPLGSVTNLSYATKQVSASFNNGTASYQLPVCLGGFSTEAITTANPTGCVGFTTLVYEPYNNAQTVTAGVWQTWNVSNGTFWSSRDYDSGTGCIVTKGAGGPPFYSLASLAASCPNAVATGFGVNVGSYNPSYDIYVDQIVFNDTAYNFEPFTVPAPVTLSSKDDCKADGWKASTNPAFKNQGDCVSYFATKGKNPGSGVSFQSHSATGNLTLSNPAQVLNFAVTDRGASAADLGALTYSNPGAALTYTAQITCANVSGTTAYFAYQIPTDAPVAAGTWVVWKVVDGSPDSAGFTTAADQAGANAVCEAGSAAVTNYTIVTGDVKVV